LETLLANSSTPGYGTAGSDTDGPMSDFDPHLKYTLAVVHMDPAGTYTGPTDSATLTASTNFDVGLFANKDAGNNPINPAAFSFQWDPANTNLNLIYSPTAVPEPGTLALTALGAIIAWRVRRRANR
jgi:hypothetical protein